MDALSELQNRISLLVSSKSSISDFGEWFIERLWDVEQSADKKTKSAFYTVEGILAEASHAKWNYAGVREELTAAIRPLEKVSAQRHLASYDSQVIDFSGGTQRHPVIFRSPHVRSQVLDLEYSHA